VDRSVFSAAFSGGPIEAALWKGGFASAWHFPLLLAAAPLKLLAHIAVLAQIQIFRCF